MAGKNLVAYYSKSGNTRAAAEAIYAATGGELCEIVPLKAYPRSFLLAILVAIPQIRRGTHPEIRLPIESVEGYDTVYVGTPNWGKRMAPPVATFLARFSLADKRVVPFCSAGGGEAGVIRQEVEAACPGATVLPCLAVRGGDTSGVRDWLQRNGLIES